MSSFLPSVPGFVFLGSGCALKLVCNLTPPHIGGVSKGKRSVLVSSPSPYKSPFFSRTFVPQGDHLSELLLLPWRSFLFSLSFCDRTFVTFSRKTPIFTRGSFLLLDVSGLRCYLVLVLRFFHFLPLLLQKNFSKTFGRPTPGSGSVLPLCSCLSPQQDAFTDSLNNFSFLDIRCLFCCGKVQAPPLPLKPRFWSFWFALCFRLRKRFSIRASPKTRLRSPSLLFLVTLCVRCWPQFF